MFKKEILINCLDGERQNKIRIITTFDLIYVPQQTSLMVLHTLIYLNPFVANQNN